jgi:hypothetical protein
MARRMYLPLARRERYLDGTGASLKDVSFWGELALLLEHGSGRDVLLTGLTLALALALGLGLGSDNANRDNHFIPGTNGRLVESWELDEGALHAIGSDGGLDGGGGARADGARGSHCWRSWGR